VPKIIVGVARRCGRHVMEERPQGNRSDT